MPRLLRMLNRFLFSNKSLPTLLTDNIECRSIDMVSPRFQLLRHGLCGTEDLFVGWLPRRQDLIQCDVRFGDRWDECVGESVVVYARVYQNAAGGIGFACGLERGETGNGTVVVYVSGFDVYTADTDLKVLTQNSQFNLSSPTTSLVQFGYYRGPFASCDPCTVFIDGSTESSGIEFHWILPDPLRNDYCQKNSQICRPTLS